MAYLDENYGEDDWHNDNQVTPGAIRPGSYVLQVETGDDGYIKKPNACWIYVDDVVPGGKEYHTLLQRRKLSKGMRPPFELDDEFKNCLMDVNNTFGKDFPYDHQGNPKPRLLKRLKEMYGKREPEALLTSGAGISTSG